jgi:N-acetylglucosaminyl-diphospho-decaprenol L-rhamnosyltransferase
METNSGFPTLSIVIVNWNTKDLLRECLHSILLTVHKTTYEIIVVDNSSTDGSVNTLSSLFPSVMFIRNSQNVGFACANNQGMAISRGSYILLLNSDAELMPDTVDEAIHFINTHPDAGAVGVRLLNPDGSFQQSYVNFPTLWSELLMISKVGRILLRSTYPSYGPSLGKGPQKVDCVSGAFLLVRRAVVDKIAGLDESYFMYSEEVDWCYRMKMAGWEVWYLPDATVFHLWGGSSSQKKTQMEAELYCSKIRFFRKHYGAWQSFLLKWSIYTFTSIKNFYYCSLMKLTKNKRGRVTPNLREMHDLLKSV